jgi:pimeloyl-ACP methyl ester carboxylesterase
VHGLTRQGRDFDPLAVALVQKGYRVVCPDLAGRGQSESLGDPEDYGIPRYAADITTLLARLNVEAVDWIGTSLGGLTGMHMAAHEKAPIRRMIINDVGAFLPWPALNRISIYLQKMPRRFPNFHAAEAYFREILAPFGNLGDSEWYHLTRHSIAREEDGRFRMLVDARIARAIRPMLFYSVNLWRQWDAISCPILLLRGAHSDLLPPEVASEMTARGPRAKLVEFPDCGHAPALMDHRQIRTVTTWLTREQGA